VLVLIAAGSVAGAAVVAGGVDAVDGLVDADGAAVVAGGVDALENLVDVNGAVVASSGHA